LIALNAVYFVISSPLNAASPVADYLQHHPEGVADIALRVTNLPATIDRSRRLGVEVIQDIRLHQSSSANFKFAKIFGWNDLQHTLIETGAEQDYCLPLDLQPAEVERPNESHLTQIDHIVLNVAKGALDPAVELYQKLFELKVQQSFKIQTPSSGLTSQALIDQEGDLQFNINQPATANSQIQEFIDFNRGSGIQHLALRSRNLIADVAQLRQGELEFLAIPPTYYDNRPPLSALNERERASIAQQQILVDSDQNSPESLLMQIFTQPILEKPTFFLEFIERRNSAQGFGKGNFTALFEAVERQNTKIKQTISF
ncbi:MAG: 4-hydroxyphenylpyruvate dioxygenase family protein, partial [Waterburya sp.]